MVLTTSHSIHKLHSTIDIERSSVVIPCCKVLTSSQQARNQVAIDRPSVRLVVPTQSSKKLIDDINFLIDVSDSYVAILYASPSVLLTWLVLARRAPIIIITILLAMVWLGHGLRSHSISFTCGFNQFGTFRTFQKNSVHSSYIVTWYVGYARVPSFVNFLFNLCN